MKDFQQVFEVADRTARKYFKNNQDIFLASNFDVDDLIQEAQSVTFETIKKYSNGKYGNHENKNPKDSDYISRVCSMAVGWKLKDVLKSCRRKYLKMQEHRETQGTQSVNLFDIDENSVALPNELNPNQLNRMYRINSLGFRFEELCSFLSEDEYDIVSEIIKNSMTFENLSDKYECSREWIRQQYLQAISKIKKYLQL